MAQAHYKALLGKVLLGFITEKDPVLVMLEWVADQMMLIEAEAKVGAEKGKHSRHRKTYFSRARLRRMDTRLGTIYLYVPKLRKGGSETGALMTISESNIRLPEKIKKSP